MDEADLAQIQMEHQLEMKRRPAPITLVPTGFCLNCGEDVPVPRRWCDFDCMSDWQKRN